MSLVGSTQLVNHLRESARRAGARNGAFVFVGTRGQLATAKLGELGDVYDQWAEGSARNALLTPKDLPARTRLFHKDGQVVGALGVYTGNEQLDERLISSLPEKWQV